MRTRLIPVLALTATALLMGCEAEPEPAEEFEVRGAPLGTEQNPVAGPDTAVLAPEAPVTGTDEY